jgi:transposase
MAMGRLSNRLKAAGTGSRLAVDVAPRHAFYDWCNEVLAEAEFDEVVEMLCQPYYQDGVGRPSIPPGRYFRMLFVGQFEGLDSEREIAWRCADSLSLHRFLHLSDGETVPDHSTWRNRSRAAGAAVALSPHKGVGLRAAALRGAKVW